MISKLNENLNPIFQSNPNQVQRYKEELERRKKELEENLQKNKIKNSRNK